MKLASEWRFALWSIVFGGLVPPGDLLAQTEPGDLPITPWLERIFYGDRPRTLEDFQAMERHLQALLEKILPSVVSFDGSSGVIVEDGYVLSAGHCTVKPGKTVELTLHDGRIRPAQQHLGHGPHLRVPAAGR